VSPMRVISRPVIAGGAGCPGPGMENTAVTDVTADFIAQALRGQTSFVPGLRCSRLTFTTGSADPAHCSSARAVQA